MFLCKTQNFLAPRVGKKLVKTFKMYILTVIVHIHGWKTRKKDEKAMDGLAGATSAVAAQINATHNPNIFPLMAPLG